MYLSKSKYCKGVQCKKILWLDKNHPELKEEVSNQDVFENGTEVGELAKKLFGEYIDIKFDDNLQNMINDTNNAMKNNECIICEASFTYNNCFCSVDLLKKHGNKYEIYEVKSSTDVHDIYIDDISYQYYVLSNLGLNVTKCNIVHINNEYVRKGDLNIQELFKICDVTDKVLSKQIKVKQNIEDINKYVENDSEPIKDIDYNCTTPYECPYWNYCSKHLSKPNVFDLKGQGLSTKKKFELYKEGIYAFKDLMRANIPDKFKEQILFELNNLPLKINKEYIEEFLNTLTYPLYFLDFETFQQPIPEFDYVKPFAQIPFQYSLHYLENASSELKHTEFLGDGITDPRRELAIRLVKDIPKDTCVLAYNMRFEKGRIKEMAELFPDLKDHLMNIHDNIKDLMIPFQTRNYYVKEMQGSFSIKYVLPSLFPDDPSLDYHNLDMIHNGSEAMNMYASINAYSKEEQEEIRKNMLEYCKLDTYAMVKIYNKLKTLTK